MILWIMPHLSFPLTGDASSTGNLQITSVEISDDASYQCMVITSTGGHPPLYSLPAFLSVQGKKSTGLNMMVDVYVGSLQE